MKGLFVFIGLISLHAFSQSKPLFTLLNAKQTGVHFNNEIRENEAQNVLDYEYFYNGGGVALGDINNDGLPDIITLDMMPEDNSRQKLLQGFPYCCILSAERLRASIGSHFHFAKR